MGKIAFIYGDLFVYWHSVILICGVLTAVFLFLGYYPICKPKIEAKGGAVIKKLMLFNAAILIMYALLIRLFGMAQIAAEYQELGTIMTAVMLIMGNVTFFLLDRVLTRFSRIK